MPVRDWLVGRGQCLQPILIRSIGHSDRLTERHVLSHVPGGHRGARSPVEIGGRVEDPVLTVFIAQGKAVNVGEGGSFEVNKHAPNRLRSLGAPAARLQQEHRRKGAHQEKEANPHDNRGTQRGLVSAPSFSGAQFLKALRKGR